MRAAGSARRAGGARASFGRHSAMKWNAACPHGWERSSTVGARAAASEGGAPRGERSSGARSLSQAPSASGSRATREGDGGAWRAARGVGGGGARVGCGCGGRGGEHRGGVDDDGAEAGDSRRPGNAHQSRLLLSEPRQVARFSRRGVRPKAGLSHLDVPVASAGLEHITVRARTQHLAKAGGEVYRCVLCRSRALAVAPVPLQRRLWDPD